MRKLFSAMLAATMVAGASITAFAYADSDSNWDTNYFGDNDYAVIGAYDEDGVKLDGKNNKARVDSGDKIYYPILLSGDEIDKDILTEHGQGEKMFFADKASEVKDLKASVKDEVGGKYIDSASIVKKDIKITTTGDTQSKDVKEVFTADLSKVVPKTVAGAEATEHQFTVKLGALELKGEEVATDDTVKLALDGDETKTITTDAKDTVDKIATKLAAEDWANYKAVAKGDIITFTATNSGAASKKAKGATVTFTDTTGNKITMAAAQFDNVAATGTDKGAETYTATVGNTNITGIAAATNEAFLNALNKEEVTIGSDKYVADTTTPTAVKFTASSSGNKTNVTSLNITNAEINTVGKVGVVTNGSEAATGSNLAKIYCVEVKMSDYFKNEETEVEFNIKLKNKGKTEYDTDDDNKLFNGTFDLGRDSETLDVRNKKAVDGIEVKKFKNGDLEIKIGKDTKSVQLDEAINSKGDKEDIDTIYIENDDSIDSAFTFDVKASNQDDLYLELNQDAIKDLAVSNQKADLTFFNFPGTPEFDFAGTATFAVEDEDEDNYFYEVVDGELVETKAKYNDDDGVFELRTNKLGSYVISDKELDTSTKEEKKDDDTENKEQEAAGGDLSADSTQNNGGKGNANTGAADLIGVASALAVVSVAAAGAVALKK